MFIKIKINEAQKPIPNLVSDEKCNILKRVNFTIKIVFLVEC